jgi:hypothetical protein
MSEKLLRAWVQEVMGPDVTWVEPSRGATPGLPDAQFHIDGVIFPVELKWWWLRSRNRGRLPGRILHDMRPAQIRYHIMSARKGIKTAIMFVAHAHDSTKTLVYLVAGKYCPKPEHLKLPMSESFTCTAPKKAAGFFGEKPSIAKARIKAVLQSKEFWE